MTDEPLDITNDVKSFDLIFSTGLNLADPKTGESNTFTWNFTPQGQPEIKFTVEASDIPTLMNWDGQQVMKMENKGKYWFDTHFTADVIMTDLQIAEDGTITARYLGVNIKDLTNRSIFARFLRWLLRR